MEIGIDSFAAVTADPALGRSIEPATRLRNLIEEIERADQVGIDVFGIGEHHRREFLDSAPSMILAAAALTTKRIRLTSAVTVLSANDPVRVFQEFATLDLLSQGRAEIIAGRGSFIEAFPLFGLSLEDYDDLFTEKLDLLLKLRASERITWSGRFRPPLIDASVYPRPFQTELPIWVGVGGSPESFIRAGKLGLPLMIAIIGGEPRRFRPLIELYRKTGREAGHSPDRLRVGVHLIGFAGDTDEEAATDFYPGWAAMFTAVGRERGWAPATRSQFDALCGPHGALTIGSPQTIREKIDRFNRDLGGLVRVSLQMTVAALPHAKMLHAITLLGTQVRLLAP